VLYERQLVHEL